MKLPNGYGSVTKLSGKRRRPWIARITDGCTEVDGKINQTRKTIGYFETRAKALAALAEYNQKPYNLDEAELTFAEIYERWSAGKKGIVESSRVGYKISYDHSKPLHDRIFRSLRASDMQSILDSGEHGNATQCKLISLWHQLYKYAIANDIADKDYADFVNKTAAAPESKRKPFTEKEIDDLRELVGSEPYADVVLILIYTGWRIGELLAMRTADIDLTEWTMKGGAKTEAGKNRLVPIHKRIRPYVAARMSDKEFFLDISYYKFQKVFDEICSLLGTSHTIHDTRHTFATLADNVGMNKVCIKRLMGHKTNDVTDKVYTHKDLEQLRKAIDLLP